MNTEATRAMVNALDRGAFEEVDAMLLNGANIDKGSIQQWHMLDYGGDGYNEDVPYFFLKEAFMSKRLDIVEYLLSRGANFSLVQKEVLADIEKSNTEYAFLALKLIAKHQPGIFLNMGESGDNILHYLSRCEVTPAVKSSWPRFTRDASQNIEFNFSPDQINALLSGMVINPLLVNRKNAAGDTPLHMAVRNGHTGMISWLMSNGMVDLSVRDRNNKTAAELASAANNAVAMQFACYEKPVARTSLGGMFGKGRDETEKSVSSQSVYAAGLR